MKIKLTALAFLFICRLVYSQGAYVFDQQSTNLIEGARPFRQLYQPVGQSFTPTLSSVGFVMLNLFDAGSLPTGATVFVNLLSNSITGSVLGSTAPVFMPDGFSGISNFTFSNAVSVTPGVSYYIQPIIQSGDNFSVYVTDTSYSGTAYSQGSPQAFAELWFREGIVVPEPSSIVLALLGTGVLAWRCRKSSR